MERSRSRSPRRPPLRRAGAQEFLEPDEEVEANTQAMETAESTGEFSEPEEVEASTQAKLAAESTREFDEPNEVETSTHAVSSNGEFDEVLSTQSVNVDDDTLSQ